MTERLVLDATLVLAFGFAPWMTNRFFVGRDPRYAAAHAISLLAVIVTLALGSGVGAPIWALFCVGGFAWHVRRSGARIVSLTGLASFVPFVFSVISAIWFVAGTSELSLLGYNRAWSFYAALHGSVLGWLFVGCVAFLAQRPRAHPIFLGSCFACFVLFLFVALGIDGVPYLKRVGVIGLSLVVPLAIARFALEARQRGGAPLRWALASLAGVIVSMGIALANEFWSGFPRVALGLPTMVLTHGVLNAMVVVPFFFFAVRADDPDKPTGTLRVPNSGSLRRR